MFINKFPEIMQSFSVIKPIAVGAPWSHAYPETQQK